MQLSAASLLSFYSVFNSEGFLLQKSENVLKESQFGNVKKPISVIKCPTDASFLVYKKCTFKSINGKMLDPLTMKILSINSHFFKIANTLART